MKKKITTLLIILSTSFLAQAQNVGIGIATPNSSAKLEISASNQGVLLPRVSLTGTTDATTITNGNTPSLLIYNTATVNDVTPGFYYWTGTIWQRMGIQQDADWYMVGTSQAPTGINDNIYTNGNVGIGTTAPTQRFEVNGGSLLRNTVGSFFWSERSDSDFDIVQSNTSTKRAFSIHPSPTGNNPLAVYWNNGGGNQPALHILNTNGFVGIRTNVPSNALTVNGVAEIRKVGDRSSIYFTSRATDPGFIRHIVNNNAAEMRFVVSDDVDANSSVDYFSFGGETGSVFTEIMRINGARNVGIGTTTPAQRLHVVGNILASGNIISSDSRYKRNSKTLSNCTALLQQLHPVQYYFKEGFAEGQFDQRLHFGLLAQEVEEKLPHLVYEDQEGYKSINYTELIPVLIKSNQEQQALIESQQKAMEQQQAQIEALQKNVQALQSSK